MSKAFDYIYYINTILKLALQRLHSVFEPVVSKSIPAITVKKNDYIYKYIYHRNLHQMIGTCPLKKLRWGEASCELQHISKRKDEIRGKRIGVRALKMSTTLFHFEISLQRKQFSLPTRKHHQTYLHLDRQKEKGNFSWQRQRIYK